MRLNQIAVGVFALLTAFSARADRPEWDQQEAEKTVKAIVEMESRGDFGWAEIKWNTDADNAAETAQKKIADCFA